MTNQHLSLRNDGMPLSKPFTYPEDTSFLLSDLGLDISPSVPTYTVPVSLTIAATKGLIDGESTYAHTGPLEDLTTLLSTITYSPSLNSNVYNSGLDSIDFVVEGEGVEKMEGGVKVLSEPVNDEPVVEGGDMETGKVRDSERWWREARGFLKALGMKLMKLTKLTHKRKSVHPPTPQNAPLILSSLQITDVDGSDSPEGFLTADLTCSSCTFTSSNVGGVYSLHLTPQTLSLKGSPSNVNAALKLTTFTSSNVGSDFVKITVNDNGNHGSGGSKTTTETFKVTVNDVNAKPVIAVDSTLLHINEDEVFQFRGRIESEMYHNGLHKLTVKASDGGVWVSDNTVKVVKGGKGEGEVEVLGSFKAIENLLDEGISYVLNQDENVHHHGPIQFTLELSDEVTGNIQTGTQTINIIVDPVNDPPTITSSTSTHSYEILEDQTLALNSVVVVDADTHPKEAGSKPVSLKITSLNGVIYFASSKTVPGLNVVQNVTSDIYTDLVIMGDIATINEQFATSQIKFKPTKNFNGDVKLKFTVDDLGNGDGGSTSLIGELEYDVTVRPVNSAPLINLSSQKLSTPEDTPLALENVIEIVDYDFDDPLIHEQAKVTVSITCDVGTVASSYVSPADNVIYSVGNPDQHSKAIVFSSSVAEVNSLLGSMVYQPEMDWNSEDQSKHVTVDIVVNDQGNVGTDSKPLTASSSLYIVVDSVNDGAVIVSDYYGPVDVQVESTFNVGKDLEVLDVDGSSSQLITLKVDIDDGLLGFSSPESSYALAFQTVEAKTLTVKGTIENLNTFLSELTYYAATKSSAATALRCEVQDGEFTNSVELQLNIQEVKHKPEISSPASINAEEDKESVLSVAVSSKDLQLYDAITVQISAAEGTVKVSKNGIEDVIFSQGVQDATSKVVEFRASIEDANVVLETLTYVPLKDSPTSATSQDVVTVKVTDNKSKPSQVELKTVLVNVGAVNDAPSVIVSNDLETDENTEVKLSGVTFQDLESGGLYTATLTSTFGQLKVTSTSGVYASTNSWSGSVTVTGGLGNLNSAVASIMFKPISTFTGKETIAVSVQDEGGLSSSSTVAVTVNSVNDPPVISLPSDAQMAEDGQLTLDGVDVSASDTVDLTLTLTTSDLTLLCSGEADTSTLCEYSGTEAEVNVKVKATTVIPPANFNSVQSRGLPTVSIVVYDTQTSFTSSTLSIYVSPVNDAPSISFPETVVVGAVGNTDIYSVSIADIDAEESGDEVVTLTVEATTGTVTLATLSGLASATATPLSSTTGYPSISFRGTIASINAAISPVTTPTLSAPASSEILEDSSMGFSLFSVSSLVAGAESTMAYYAILTVSAGRGYFTYPESFPDVTIAGSANNDVVGGETSLTVTGLPSDITALLGSPSLTLTPQTNHNGVDHLIFTVSTSLNPNLITTVAHNLYVTPVNDAPSVAGAAAFNAKQGVATRLEGVQLVDPDSSDSSCSGSGIMTLTASLPSGSTSLISISPTATGGVEVVSGAGALTGAATMTVRGSLEGLQSSVNTLSFSSAAEFVGAEEVALDFDDEGNCGGPALTSSATLSVKVYASNDAPTITSTMLTAIQGASDTGNIFTTSESQSTWKIFFLFLTKFRLLARFFLSV